MSALQSILERLKRKHTQYTAQAAKVQDQIDEIQTILDTKAMGPQLGKKGVTTHS